MKAEPDPTTGATMSLQTGASSATASPWTSGLPLKLGMVVAVGAIVVVVTLLARHLDEGGEDGSPHASATASASASMPAPVLEVDAIVGSAPAPAVVDAPLAVAPEARPAIPTPRVPRTTQTSRVSATTNRDLAPAPAPTTSAGQLAAELAAIDAARAALRAGDSAQALARLDAFDRRFPHAALAQEARVARIEAMVAHGDGDGARAVATRFLAAHPNNPSAARVRRLVAGADTHAEETP